MIESYSTQVYTLLYIACEVWYCYFIISQISNEGPKGEVRY